MFAPEKKMRENGRVVFRRDIILRHAFLALSAQLGNRGTVLRI